VIGTALQVMRIATGDEAEDAISTPVSPSAASYQAVSGQALNAAFGQRRRCGTHETWCCETLHSEGGIEAKGGLDRHRGAGAGWGGDGRGLASDLCSLCDKFVEKNTRQMPARHCILNQPNRRQRPARPAAQAWPRVLQLGSQSRFERPLSSAPPTSRCLTPPPAEGAPIAGP
jgi:hypothetical protein